MVLGDVERVEVVVARLDLRPVEPGEAEPVEHVDQLVRDLGERMQRADARRDAGLGRIEVLDVEPRQDGGDFELATTSRKDTRLPAKVSSTGTSRSLRSRLSVDRLNPGRDDSGRERR